MIMLRRSKRTAYTTRQQQQPEKGYEEVPKDGDCFFHCCSRRLGICPKQIRRQCTQHLRQHAHFCKTYGISREDVRFLEQEGRWDNHAMDFMPKVVAELYHVDVEVRGWQCFPSPQQPPNLVIRLRYQHDHYDLLL
jgi:hypothetical protein